MNSEETSAPPPERLIAMLSDLGMEPDLDGPASFSEGRSPFARPVEREFIRLLEQFAGDHRHAREMPRDRDSFGRYTILKEIDRGESAIIYLADDPDQGRPMALKVPRPGLLDDADRRRRFELEGRVGTMLDHPNIVPIHEVGAVAGLPYIAMPYVEGETMADWLLAEGPTTPRQASRMVREIAGAVGHAHDRGILNLDLKPRNIILGPGISPDPGGFGLVPSIIDFGLAKVLGADDEATDGGALIGTPPYMSPEQILEGSEGCGPPADVYALGVILYELLIGRPPHQGENRFQSIRASIVDEPVPPRSLRPSVPPELEAICLRCLEKSPEDRYSTAKELQEALGRFLDEIAPPARIPTP